MWLFELVGLVLIVGTVVGLVWRYAEDWLERSASRRQLKRELETAADVATASQPPVTQNTSTNSTTNSN